MAIARPVRALTITAVVLWFLVLYRIFRAPSSIHGPGERYINFERDPNLDPTDEPEGILRRASERYAPDAKDSARIPATLLALVRNEEVDDMVQSMKDLERTWNHKFNYPWTFFNDEPFSQEFKRKTQAVTKAKCIYEQIPREHWATPSWIDQKVYDESAKILEESGVQYAKKVSYHQMCRWNSGMFYKHPALQNTRYYWRVEPKVHFFCDIDYDIFAYMLDNNKTYGFTINLYDDPKTLPTLWPETVKFLTDNPKYPVHEQSALRWLTDDVRRPENNKRAQGYSTCHFWSNFEVADMEFWRSPVYQDYFDHLDHAGGFFYERWGDAPVHSIALGLWEDASKVHWFRDIGYQHIPFFNCPNSPKCKGCVTGRLTDGEPFLHREDCRPNWFKYAGMG
ncbi:glycolipid 2-alpha-mannosyltransferase [Hirsutella rhossiliensis]|uniref:Glycolipid 2-alpha-mannosyltransferase domain-containing protein n=1 Tax=Hirsutella rhossiliensis TaxID=111463 RepID=A0A9P8N178_9HYPO|nr:glycolipid 2-alpha-mannosyltransferase domain-containing protein [Hirsutella rhossiliensis]KAH0964974.1 glycolipid 2-alpha-mannosyltransferase domain-containing protein [Hirsutella rhossiliensis]